MSPQAARHHAFLLNSPLSLPCIGHHRHHQRNNSGGGALPAGVCHPSRNGSGTPRFCFHVIAFWAPGITIIYYCLRSFTHHYHAERDYLDIIIPRHERCARATLFDAVYAIMRHMPTFSAWLLVIAMPPRLLPEHRRVHAPHLREPFIFNTRAAAVSLRCFIVYHILACQVGQLACEYYTNSRCLNTPITLQYFILPVIFFRPQCLFQQNTTSQ